MKFRRFWLLFWLLLTVSHYVYPQTLQVAAPTIIRANFSAVLNIQSSTVSTISFSLNFAPGLVTSITAIPGSAAVNAGKTVVCGSTNVFTVTQCTVSGGTTPIASGTIVNYTVTVANNTPLANVVFTVSNLTGTDANNKPVTITLITPTTLTIGSQFGVCIDKNTVPNLIACDLPGFLTKGTTAIVFANQNSTGAVLINGIAAFHRDGNGYSATDVLTGGLPTIFTFDGSVWKEPAAVAGGSAQWGAVVLEETPIGVLDGVNQSFQLAHVPVTIQLYMNGIRQKNGLDYTVSSFTITFATGAIPQTGDVIMADYTWSGH